MRAQGRGLIFLTPHLGCFEIAARAYAERFGPITVLYRPARKPWLRALIESARAGPNLATAPATLIDLGAADEAQECEVGVCVERLDNATVPVVLMDEQIAVEEPEKFFTDFPQHPVDDRVPADVPVEADVMVAVSGERWGAAVIDRHDERPLFAGRALGVLDGGLLERLVIGAVEDGREPTHGE